MAGNTFGTIFRLTTFGESHGAAIGAVVDGCPSGVPLSEDDIQRELDRRKPGNNFGAAGTGRREADKARIVSGVFEGATEGTPIAIIIENTNQHSGDYKNLAATFRPGHGDFSYFSKYGIRDYRGGGRASGRETACRVAGGAVARAFLNLYGIKITAYTIKAAGISCRERDLSVIEKNMMRAPDAVAAEKMISCIEALRAKGESAGGVIECVISGVPAGLGEPIFDKLDAELAKAVVSIGAVKGIEFGAGFSAADLTGSENNDDMRVSKIDDSHGAAHGVCSVAAHDVEFVTNNAGGVLAGISSGQDVVFRAAIKPVPSIFMPQKTVRVHDMSSAADIKNYIFENTDIEIKGRHDVCLCPRIVPVIEAMSSLVMADMILRNRCSRA